MQFIPKSWTGTRSKNHNCFWMKLVNTVLDTRPVLRNRIISALIVQFLQSHQSTAYMSYNSCIVYFGINCSLLSMTWWVQVLRLILFFAVQYVTEWIQPVYTSWFTLPCSYIIHTLLPTVYLQCRYQVVHCTDIMPIMQDLFFQICQNQVFMNLNSSRLIQLYTSWEETLLHFVPF